MIEFVVDLDTFARNLRTIRDRVAPAQHMLVVKDDAYRHGLERIVQRAVTEGITWFGALDVVTGVGTRAASGPEARIFTWMLAGADDVREALAADLDLGIGTAELLETVASVAEAAGTVANVHLKIDTGLHRNGVRAEQWEAFVARAAAFEAAGVLRVVGIWTHIAEASDADDDDQRAVYEQAVAQARVAGLAPELLHLAASAAAFAREDFRYDMVRIGAFAYGIRSTDGPSDTELGIAPIGALRSEVLRVANIAVTVDGGFADGLLSTAAGKLNAATPGGVRRVSAVRADTSSIEPWDGAKAGEQVTLYGGAADSATDLAERLGTIGEEVILRLSREVPRRYKTTS